MFYLQNIECLPIGRGNMITGQWHYETTIQWAMRKYSKCIYTVNIMCLVVLRNQNRLTVWK